MLTLILAAALMFPAVSGDNLHGDTYSLPDDFSGSLNIVMIAFQRQQQAEVDTWLPLAKELEAEHAEMVRYWELPTISSGMKYMRFIIDNGMRSGIPDSTARERTITLYIDREPFIEELDIPSKDSIEVLLVNDAGEILWRARGPRTDSAAAQLRKRIQELAG